jgi:hypothetical protein
MVETRSSEKSDLARPIRRHIPGDSILHSHQYENLKSYNEQNIIHLTANNQKMRENYSCIISLFAGNSAYTLKNAKKNCVKFMKYLSNVQNCTITKILNFLPLGVASCCATIQLVPYDAVNRNKVSILVQYLY